MTDADLQDKGVAAQGARTKVRLVLRNSDMSTNG
jgi:hypothetical protein